MRKKKCDINPDGCNKCRAYEDLNRKTEGRINIKEKEKKDTIDRINKHILNIIKK